MKLSRYEYVKSSMSVFSLGLLQDFINISNALSDYGIEVSELHEFVADNKKLFAGNSAARNMEIQASILYCVCPKCGNGLNIEPLNTSNRNVIEDPDPNGDIYRSLATCRDESGCGWQKYSVKPLDKLVRSFFPKELNLELEDLEKNEITAHGLV